MPVLPMNPLYDCTICTTTCYHWLADLDPHAKISISADSRILTIADQQQLGAVVTAALELQHCCTYLSQSYCKAVQAVPHRLGDSCQRQ